MIKLTSTLENPPKEVEEWLDATGKYLSNNIDKIMDETPMVCEIVYPIEETIKGSAREIMTRIYTLSAVYGDLTYELKGKEV